MCEEAELLSPERPFRRTVYETQRRGTPSDAVAQRTAPAAAALECRPLLQASVRGMIHRRKPRAANGLHYGTNYNYCRRRCEHSKQRSPGPTLNTRASRQKSVAGSRTACIFMWETFETPWRLFGDARSSSVLGSRFHDFFCAGRH